MAQVPILNAFPYRAVLPLAFFTDSLVLINDDSVAVLFPVS